MNVRSLMREYFEGWLASFCTKYKFSVVRVFMCECARVCVCLCVRVCVFVEYVQLMSDTLRLLLK